MKKTLIIISSALLMLAFCGCSTEVHTKADKNSSTTDNVSNPPQSSQTQSMLESSNIEITQDIILSNIYSNYAYGYQCYATVIDKEGCVYRFDFSDTSQNWEDDRLLDEMQKMVKTAKKPQATFSQEDINTLYELLYKVDKNNEFESKFQMCDAGQSTLYGIRYDSGSAELIKIYSCGDVLDIPKDDNAKQIYKKYYEIISNYKST